MLRSTDVQCMRSRSFNCATKTGFPKSGENALGDLERMKVIVSSFMSMGFGECLMKISDVLETQRDGIRRY